MKSLIVLLAFVLSCCSPVVERNAVSANVGGGSLSCHNMSCCWPYLHHRDVKNVHVAACVSQRVNKEGWTEMSISMKGYFR